MKPSALKSWLNDPNRPSLVMGVLNVTPDSFSDGGKFASPENAIAHAREMVAQGADWIDIGGESTKPGSDPVSPDEQIHRVVPVIQALAGKLETIWSIDTRSSAVAEAALDAGAHMVNDISAGLTDPTMLPMIARRKVPVVLMHMQGTPKTMQEDPTYRDVVAEVIQSLRARVAAAQKAGIELSNILIDPGIGFGKTLTHNMELIRRMKEIAQQVGRPMVIGVSRKSFIGRITNEPEPSRRLFGTAASVAWAIANAAAVVRVHDVGPMHQVVRMTRAIADPAFQV